MTNEEYLEKHEDERTKCEVWTRVMGYHRPKQNFNAGKVSEFNERKFFTEKACAMYGMQKRFVSNSRSMELKFTSQMSNILGFLTSFQRHIRLNGLLKLFVRDGNE